MKRMRTPSRSRPAPTSGRQRLGGDGDGDGEAWRRLGEGANWGTGGQRRERRLGGSGWGRGRAELVGGVAESRSNEGLEDILECTVAG
jgi:hypothetical protein